MSIEPFPERVTPRKLCDRGGTINSSIPLGKLLRLSEYLDENHGQAEVYLNFERDESGHCNLTGTVTAKVSLLCQRCLETTAVDLASDLAIKLAGSDTEARQIAEGSAATLDTLEIVVCEDGELDLLAVIEDELIMSLPIVAAHDDDQCNNAFNSLHAKAEQTETAGQANIKGLDVLAKLQQELKPGRTDRKGNKDKQGNNSSKD